MFHRFAFHSESKNVFEMRRLILILFAICLAILCPAQSPRVIKGFVYNEKSGPIAGATVSAEDAGVYAKTDDEGKFEITIPDSVTELVAESRGYHTLTLKIDEQFLVFKMAIDETYASRAYQYASAELNLAKNAEKKRIDDSKNQAKAERLARTRQIDSLYNLKYKNSGIVHSFEISYGYQLAHGEVAYKNLGFREYGSLNPVEFNYTFSYRFNNFCSIGIGAGIQYQLVNLCKYPDVFDPKYTGYEDFTPINVPVFLNVRTYMTRGNLQPLFSLSGGIYCPNLEGMLDVGIGLNYRISRISNIYFLLSMRSTPYGDFRQYTASVIGGDRNFSAYYTSVAWTPSFKLGYTF